LDETGRRRRAVSYLRSNFGNSQHLSIAAVVGRKRSDNDAPTVIHAMVDRCRAANYPAAVARLRSGWVVMVSAVADRLIAAAA